MKYSNPNHPLALHTLVKLPKMLFKMIVAIVSKPIAPLHYSVKQGLINALYFN